jgi:cation transport regulator
MDRPDPYKSTGDLPESVKNVLPPHAQEIYMKAHNNALDEYKNPAERRGGASESLEEVAHRVAWAAVKQEYGKNSGGEWVKKE